MSTGRCSDDYFFFTVCGKHFSGFIEALDSEGIKLLCTLELKDRHARRAGVIFFVNKKPLEVANGAYQSIVKP